MSLISRSLPKLARSLALGACLSAALPGCALFGGSGPSTVAQGKYYSSGNPQYDEFFIALYQLQVEMAEAPQVSNAERQNLAQALGLSPETPAEGVMQRLREESLKLGRTGVHMKLEQSASPDKPDSASATIRATYRPKDGTSATLLSKIELSATNLLRTATSMKAAQITLGKLDVDAINLDADVPKAFAEARVGKQGEVKKNLADSQKLITLMKARGDDVRSQAEELLAAIAKAVNTDDGSLSPPAEPVEPPKPAESEPKKGGAKAHGKPKSASSTPASSAPAAAPKPKPTPAPAAAPAASKPKPSGGDDDAPTKPAAPSKPAPPPRDFEP